MYGWYRRISMSPIRRSTSYSGRSYDMTQLSPRHPPARTPTVSGAPDATTGVRFESGWVGNGTDVIECDPELLAAVGPRVRKSPFFDATARAGLTAVSTYNHMWLPMSYGDPDGEYLRLTTSVSMWDVAAQRHVEITGPDAEPLVQLTTVVDVSRVATGHARYAPIVGHDGTLLNDPVLLHWLDGTWRYSIADSDVGLWIEAVARERGMNARVRELDTATLAVQGPLAFDVLAALGLGWASDLETSEMRPATLDLDRRSVEVVVSRSGWSHQGGVELFLDDPTHAASLWDAVATAGEPFGIGPGTPNPTERIENVLLSYGTDTGYHANPIELGLIDHLDLDGPDFIGRDALCRIRDDGPARRLRGAVIDDPKMDTLPHPVPFVTADGETVGELRAGTSSPRFGRNIGLALVRSSCAVGSTGTVRLPDGDRHVRLVELPFTESLGEDDA